MNTSVLSGKSLVLILCLLLSFACLRAQDTPQHRLQIGMELVRFNIVQPGGWELKSLNTIQPLSGLLLRYQLHRWAIRAAANYSRDVTRFDGHNCNDCSTGEIHGSDYSLRAGAQLTLPKNRDWLYAFADLYDRHYQGEGSYYSPWTGMTYDIKSEESGLGVQLGLGLQIKLYRSLSILMETYLANERSAVNNHFPQSGGGYGNYYSRFTSVLNPGARLYLSIRL